MRTALDDDELPDEEEAQAESAKQAATCKV